MTITAMGLFSGGLDSITACRVIMDQSIRVIGLKFVTPFFDDGLIGREEAYRAEVREKYGVDVRVVDLSAGYLELLRAPKHGYGKHFNPCIDCKIFMLSRARELMEEYNASFLFTGEVLGQRPMSQRRDTLRIIERESGCEGILLRPLCARLLPETQPEREGLVDRERLYDFSGRSRKRQMELAGRYGITEYPSPAGGCILTDPTLGSRIEKFYQGIFRIGPANMSADDVRLLLVGRQFRLPGGYWFILGRREAENKRILSLAGPHDALIRMTDRPGPTGLLRRIPVDPPGDPEIEATLHKAASLIARYARKVNALPAPGEVTVLLGGEERRFSAVPAKENDIEQWRL
ncbi:MAG: DUF814 domain-containing protein [Desulfobulbaceae bacterium]